MVFLQRMQDAKSILEISDDCVVLEICERTVVLTSVPIFVGEESCFERSVSMIATYVSCNHSNDFLLSVDAPRRQISKYGITMGRVTIFFARKQAHDRFVESKRFDHDTKMAVPPLNILLRLKSRVGRVWSEFVKDSEFIMSPCELSKPPRPVHMQPFRCVSGMTNDVVTLPSRPAMICRPVALLARKPPTTPPACFKLSEPSITPPVLSFSDDPFVRLLLRELDI